MAHLLDLLKERVLLCDGGMGSRVQMLDLDVERDYWGMENCTDVLVLSRPDLVREIHRGYYEAGADMVETNTRSARRRSRSASSTSPTRRTRSTNRPANWRARRRSFKDGRQRFVLGSCRPRHPPAKPGARGLSAAGRRLTVQARGLIAGGVDAILIETCQDPLQIKAAVNGVKVARAEAGTDTPIFVQVTVETTGTLLVGSDIAAAATVIHALDVPLIGLNCATGPAEMSEHVKWLAGELAGLISVQPTPACPNWSMARPAILCWPTSSRTGWSASCATMA